MHSLMMDLDLFSFTVHGFIIYGGFVLVCTVASTYIRRRLRARRKRLGIVRPEKDTLLSLSIFKDD